MRDGASPQYGLFVPLRRTVTRPDGGGVPQQSSTNGPRWLQMYFTGRSSGRKLVIILLYAAVRSSVVHEIRIQLYMTWGHLFRQLFPLSS